MSGFSELIKNFEKTRDYVRDFFIYGFKVRNDFERKSARTYDDEKRRVESWLGDYLNCDDSVRGRQISITVDSGHVAENPLYQAYYSKSFTDNDIKLHFLLIDILSVGEWLTLKELVSRLDEDYGEFFDEQTVRNKLKEYVKEGILLTEKRGKTAYFNLSDDTAQSFINEYTGLKDALKFFSENGEFGIVGNSILKSAELKNDLFFTKHNFIVHTLEDVILPEIIEAIEQKKYLTFRTFYAKNRLNNATLGEENIVIPMQILCSVQTGRRYLVAYIPEYRRFNSFRLDFIRMVKSGSSCDEYDEIYDKYLRNTAKCFGVSFGMRRDVGAVEPIKITFTIDEETEKFVIDRLKREKRNGTLEKIGDNLFALTVDAFDPNEVMHWAKTFIGRIVSVEGGNKTVRELFYKDMLRMKKMYGGEENDDIQ